MLHGFTIDVWFHYGSFAYGLEAEVVAYGRDELCVAVTVHDPDERAEVCEFLTRLTGEPKGLLRTELRVFGPEDALSLGDVDFPVQLFTDLPPTPGWEQGVPQLSFAQLRGISPEHESHWRQLTLRIWPHWPRPG